MKQTMVKCRDANKREWEAWPCPHCGMEPFVDSWKEGHWFSECNRATCNMAGPSATSPAEAIELWNRYMAPRT